MQESSGQKTSAALKFRTQTSAALLFSSPSGLCHPLKLQCESPLQTRHREQQQQHYLRLKALSPKTKAVIQLFKILAFLQEKALFSAYLSSLQSRLCVLANGSEWLKKWVEVKVFCHPRKRHSRLLLRKSVCKHQQKLAWSCSFSLHCRDRVCPSPGQLQIGSFFRGGRWRQCRCACLPSAVRMSISAALK